MKLIRKTVVKVSSTGKSKSSYGLFYCDYCKQEVERKLNHGKENKSCGCMRTKHNIKHGLTPKHQKQAPIYQIWAGMKARCRDKNHSGYHSYGGRGIKVCKEWDEDFCSFWEWSKKNGYRKGLTIDRIDNDGNYEPDNCRFVTHRENYCNCSRVKLSFEKAEKIRKLYVTGNFRQKDLAKKYNVPQTSISRVVLNKVWSQPL